MQKTKAPFILRNTVTGEVRIVTGAKSRKDAILHVSAPPWQCDLATHADLIRYIPAGVVPEPAGPEVEPEPAADAQA